MMLSTEVLNEAINVILVVKEAIAAADAVDVMLEEQKGAELDAELTGPHRLSADKVDDTRSYNSNEIKEKKRNKNKIKENTEKR